MIKRFMARLFIVFWVMLFLLWGLAVIKYTEPLLDYLSYKSSVNNSLYFKDITNEFTEKYGVHSNYQWSSFFYQKNEHKQIEEMVASAPGYEFVYEDGELIGRNLFAEIGTNEAFTELVEENSFIDEKITSQQREKILEIEKNRFFVRLNISFFKNILPFGAGVLMLMGLQFLFLGTANPLKLKNLSKSL